jgi:hypothetical protein
MPLPGNTSSAGKKPTTPVIGTATAGTLNASVSFTASTYIGKGTINYTATSNPGAINGSSASSPITVTSLTSGTSYTFTVAGATNYGVSSDLSGFSNAVVPVAPPPTFTTPPPTFTTRPPTFTTAPPNFTTAPPNFTTAPPNFTTAPPDFTTAPPDFTTAPPDFTAAPPDFTATPPSFSLTPPPPTFDSGLGGSACFVYGTKIQMADGSWKKIEELQMWDEVMAAVIPTVPINQYTYYLDTWSSTDISGTTKSSANVIAIRLGTWSSYYLINDKIKVTYEHHILMQKGEIWSFKDVQSLSIGDHILDDDLNVVEVTSLDNVFESVPAVSITLDIYDVYFVEGLTAHNILYIK